MINKNKKIDSKLLIISSITIGGSLEWFQIGLLIFWPLLIEGMTPGFDVSVGESTNAVAILLLILSTFTSGATRALGAWIFGNEGDEKGRILAFTHTIYFSSLVTLLLFGLSFIISYESWTNYYTAIFVVFKFLQGIPAGGEIPGAICYLHESSTTSKQPWLSKRFMCSYTLFGPQIGLAMSAVVCLILKAEFPLELLKEHGWRYVFSISGSLGIIGVVIRKKLHETIKFLEYKSDHKVLHHPVRTLFSKNFHRVKLGFVLSIFEVVAFSVLSLVPFYFVNPPFELDSISILYLSLGFSGINVILLPTIGFLSSRKMNFPWIKISIWGTIAFSPILLISIMIGNIIFSLIISFFLLFFLNIQAAILPSIIAEIFPIRLRYSGIAFSFNLCDAILWSAFTGICFLFLKNGSPLFILTMPFAAITFLYGIKRSKSIKKIYKEIK